MCIDTKEINNKFQLSWELLSSSSHSKDKFIDKTQDAVYRLNRSLKWALAYANLRSYCGQIIKPYCQQYAIIIKQFWVHYFENNFITDRPPATQDFFEWYCDSKVIKEESLILL